MGPILPDLNSPVLAKILLTQFSKNPYIYTHTWNLIHLNTWSNPSSPTINSGDTWSLWPAFSKSTSSSFNQYSFTLDVSSCKFWIHWHPPCSLAMNSYLCMLYSKLSPILYQGLFSSTANSFWIKSVFNHFNKCSALVFFHRLRWDVRTGVINLE